ncbi:hypothetical protein [Halorientalis litorea]|uniref:hypothetical protein n=1 Tax=Halorientalis litorea TaxID=2931977 RepID=UPI001FF2DE2B|nr:hypothetical protein [Halorientalis litorea]
MSTADRHGESATAASDIASVCRDAGLVRLVAAPDGDALAATGVLARALDAADRPFQASVAADPDAASVTDADATVAVGHDATTADCTLEPGTTPVSERAFAVAAELGEADPVLALAGATASDVTASGDVLDAARDTDGNGVERRPGLGVPTADLVDGLAHSTLVYGPFSGDVDAARAALADCDRMLAAEDATGLDETDHRAIASLVAIRTTTADDVPPRAATAVERVLRPHVGGPFGTVEGYGDVLDAVAREQPGTGIALALGHDARDAALDVWRDHGERAHRALTSATTGRYDGLFVARGDAADLGIDGADAALVPVGTAARLLRDFRSPEPVALFVTDGRAAAAATEGHDVASAMATAADSVGGVAAGSGRRARATFETDTAAFIMAFREAL